MKFNIKKILKWVVIILVILFVAPFILGFIWAAIHYTIFPELPLLGELLS